jgi:hypothetical protein
LSFISIEEAIEGEKGATNVMAFDTSGMDTTTNSGLPWWLRVWKPSPRQSLKRLTYTRQVYDDILKSVLEYEDMLTSGVVPQLLGVTSHRLTSRGMDWRDPKRRRLVIAMNKAEAVAGKRFIMPMTEAKRKVLFNGVGPYVAYSDLPNIDRAMQTMLTLAGSEGRVLSADFSNYDSTIPADLMEMVSEVWAS